MECVSREKVEESGKPLAAMHLMRPRTLPVKLTTISLRILYPAVVLRSGEVIGDQRLFCDGCEQRVESLLRALQGVRQVRAKARNQHIEVLFDTGVLEAASIAEHLSKAGYETRLDG